jgi:hypothetical protein
MTSSSKLSGRVRFVAATLALLALASTQSRAAIFVASASAGVVLALRLSVFRSNRVQEILFASAVVLAVCGVVFATAWVASERFSPSNIVDDGSLATRLHLWQEAVTRLPASNWIFGTTDQGASTDNLPMDFMIRRGLVGVVPLASLVFLLVSRTRVGLARGKSFAWPGRILPAILFILASLIHGMTAPQEFLLWILAGAALAGRLADASDAVGPSNRMAAVLFSTFLVGSFVSILISNDLVPFRPPGSPSFLPYPPASPLPTWLGTRVGLASGIGAGLTGLALILSTYRGIEKMRWRHV